MQPEILIFRGPMSCSSFSSSKRTAISCATGIERAGVENYQITLGGDGSEDATIGEKTGPGFAYDQVVPAVERIVLAYLELRQDPVETFLQAYRRLGIGPFKAALYETDAQDAA